MRRMLDLGSGSGLIGLAIVASHPTMTGVLFDRPGVVDVARSFIREYGLEDRVAVVAGDFLVDPLGEDFDLIWTSYALPKDELGRLVTRIRKALRPGGVYVSLAEGLRDERTQPAEMINMMLSNCLHAGRDLTFAEGEVAEAMRAAGFRSIESRRLDDDLSHGPAVIDIGRVSAPGDGPGE
jgi:predicted TPR repeat methyltransferase